MKTFRTVRIARKMKGIEKMEKMKRNDRLMAELYGGSVC